MSKANNPGFVLSPYSQKKILKALGTHQQKTDSSAKRHGKPTRFNIATSDYDNLVSGEHGPLILKVRRGKSSPKNITVLNVTVTLAQSGHMPTVTMEKCIFVHPATLLHSIAVLVMPMRCP